MHILPVVHSRQEHVEAFSCKFVLNALVLTSIIPEEEGLTLSGDKTRGDAMSMQRSAKIW